MKSSRTGKTVCACGKGYASEVDQMCRYCRENACCPTRDLCRQYGIRRGEGLTLFQMEQVNARKKK